MTDILEINLDDVVEPRTVDADEEVELRIVDVRKDTDKNGYPYYLPRFEVVGDDYAKEFTQFVRIPHSDLNAKESNNAKYRLKVFFDTFDIDYSRGVSTEDMVGKTGWAILGVRDNDFTNEEENYVKRFIPPRR